eukprot:5268668-Pleurochrysis_carterae.AAC.2
MREIAPEEGDERLFADVERLRVERVERPADNQLLKAHEAAGVAGARPLKLIESNGGSRTIVAVPRLAIDLYQLAQSHVRVTNLTILTRQ